MGSSHGVPENHLEHGVSIQSGTLGIAAFEAWWGHLFGIKAQTRKMELEFLQPAEPAAGLTYSVLGKRTSESPLVS